MFDIVKYYLYEGVFHCREQKQVDCRDIRERNVAELCTSDISQMAFLTLHSSNCFQQKNRTLSYFPNFYESLTNYLLFIFHFGPLIKITRHSLSIISQTVSAAGDIRTLHTVGANKLAEFSQSTNR